MASAPSSSSSGPSLPSRQDQVAVAETGTTELVREAAGLAGELFKVEMALAKDEIAFDLRALRTSAIAWAVAVASVLLGIALLLVALIWFGGPFVALGIGAGLVVLAAGACILGVVSLPKQPMAKTMRRLRVNRALLKGHLS